MLHIYIEHFKDETIVMQSIQDDGKILAEFGDNSKNSIDLDVCIPYINQEIKVYHIYVDELEKTKSYIKTAKLESVETDSITGVKCIKYSPID